MKVVFIVLAAGLGKRFGGKIPKQFQQLRGRSLLERTLRKLSRALWAHDVVVAVPRSYARLDGIVKGLPRAFWNKVKVVDGGKTRFHSLLNALEVCQSPDFVFVHDAARPNWDVKGARRMLEVLKKDKKASAVIPLLKIRETVKRVNSKIQTIRRREELYTSQTPQLVRFQNFMAAIKKAGQRENFLDEAEILENAKLKVLAFPGDPLNIKVTYPQDMNLVISNR